MLQFCLAPRRRMSRMGRGLFWAGLAVLACSVLAPSQARAAAGDVKWSVVMTKTQSSAALAPDGTIYVGSDDQRLHAFNPDGTQKWQTAVTGNTIASSPAVGPDGTVYVGGNQKLWAFNPSDGSTKWSTAATGSTIISSPSIAPDGTIYVGSQNNKLYAFNPSDGSQKWVTGDTGNVIVCSPTVGPDGTVYVGSVVGNFYAFNPSDGTTKWSYATGPIYFSSAAIAADGTLYIGSNDQKLYALNPDGTLKWASATGNIIRYSSPAIAADGTVYIGSSDNKLWAFNPSDGSTKWTSPAAGDYITSPVVGADGVIYASSNDGKLYAFNPSNGAVLWSKTGASFFAAPALAPDGTLYLADNNAGGNTLYALYSSSLGLADSPWPRFRRDSRGAGRVAGVVVDSPSQSAGVIVDVKQSTSASANATALAQSHRVQEFIPRTRRYTFNATVSANGAAAAFRFNSTALNGTAGGLALMKLYDTNGTARAFRGYASATGTSMDGVWWVTNATNSYLPANTALTRGTKYYVNFVVTDNGAYDEDRALGTIRDPVILGLVENPGSSSGCLLNPRAGFGWEGLLVLALPGLAWLRGRRTG